MKKYHVSVPVVRSVRSCIEENAGRDMLKWASVDDDGRDRVLMVVRDEYRGDPRMECDFMTSFLAFSDACGFVTLKEDKDAARMLRMTLDMIFDDDIEDDERDDEKRYIADHFPGLVPVYFDGDRWGGLYSVSVDDCDIFDFDHFDGSFNGYAYISHDAWRRGFGDMPFDADRARDIIADECAYFTQYLQGEVFGVELWDVQNDELVDSCWGFYGSDDNDYIWAAAEVFGIDASNIELRDYDDLPDDDEFDDVVVA